MGASKGIHIESADLKAWTHRACEIAREAGDIILSYYASGDAEIEIKGDDSPVTTADKKASEHIVPALEALTPNIPVISEELKEQPDLDPSDLYWTVDPLDGTQNFIDHNDKFCVKIALMQDRQPILGVIYLPVEDRFYFSWKDAQAFTKVGDDPAETIKVRKATDPNSLTFVANCNFDDPRVYKKANTILATKGLTLPDRPNADLAITHPHYMQIAEGLIDLHLNTGQEDSFTKGNGHSWDYAPDWLILKNAGGIVVEFLTGQEVKCNTPTGRLNAMVGFGDRALANKIFPGCCPS